MHASNHQKPPNELDFDTSTQTPNLLILYYASVVSCFV